MASKPKLRRVAKPREDRHALFAFMQRIIRIRHRTRLANEGRNPRVLRSESGKHTSDALILLARHPRASYRLRGSGRYTECTLNRILKRPTSFLDSLTISNRGVQRAERICPCHNRRPRSRTLHFAEDRERSRRRVQAHRKGRRPRRVSRNRRTRTRAQNRQRRVGRVRWARRATNSTPTQKNVLALNVLVSERPQVRETTALLAVVYGEYNPRGCARLAEAVHLRNAGAFAREVIFLERWSGMKNLWKLRVALANARIAMIWFFNLWCRSVRVLLPFLQEGYKTHDELSQWLVYVGGEKNRCDKVG